MISPQEQAAYEPTGYQMIRTIQIDNFRCYRHLKLEKVARLNVVVGDNGSGKTALLEAIFMPLATTSELAVRYRQQRGLDGNFSGSRRVIEDAIWGDYFYEGDYKSPIQIQLTGDGPEARSLTITRNQFPTTASTVGLLFRNAQGKEKMLHPSFNAQGQVLLPETGEDLPNFFYFASASTTGSVEQAARFSDMSKARSHAAFVKTLVSEYRWLQDLNIEVIAGSPALFGTLDGSPNKIPLPNMSGGINKMAGIMATIASRTRSIVLVDEIENGIYFKHQNAIWKGLLRFLREHDAQMICTTHSKEWLEALVEAAGDKVDDISLWRVERAKGQPTVRQFSGSALRSGIEHGTEIRSPNE